MKKTTRALHLRTETIRQLSPAQLAVPAGGFIPASKTGPKGNTCDADTDECSRTTTHVCG